MVIPTSEEEITKEYLNNVLKGFPTIKSVSVVKPKTHGMMSNVRIVNLEYEETNEEVKYNPPSIVVKYSLPTQENFLTKNGNDIMKSGGLYQREVRMYETLNQNEQTKTFLPLLYYSELDVEGNFVLVMKHILLVEKEVKSITDGNDLLKSANLEQSRLIITKLAKFHATFWHTTSTASESSIDGILNGNYHSFLKDRKLEFIPHHFAFLFHTRNFGDFQEENQNWAQYTDESLEKISSIFDKSVPSLNLFVNERLEGDEKEKFVAQVNSKTIEDFKSGFFNAFQSMNHLSSKLGVTLVHGDFRFDNMIFHVNDQGEEDVSFVDWQCISVGNGLFDVSTFLHNSLSFEELQEHEDTFLQLYHDQLITSNPSIKLSLDDVKEYYKLAMWYEVLNATETAAYIHNLYLPAQVSEAEKSQLADRIYGRLKRSILLGCPRVFS